MHLRLRNLRTGEDLVVPVRPKTRIQDLSRMALRHWALTPPLQLVGTLRQVWLPATRLSVLRSFVNRIYITDRRVAYTLRHGIGLCSTMTVEQLHLRSDQTLLVTQARRHEARRVLEARPPRRRTGSITVRYRGQSLLAPATGQIRDLLTWLDQYDG